MTEYRGWQTLFSKRQALARISQGFRDLRSPPLALRGRTAVGS